MDKNTTITKLKGNTEPRKFQNRVTTPICSRISRNRGSIIVKSNKDDNTEILLKIIKEVKHLKDITEISYKMEHRIIITGVPNCIDHEQLITTIKSYNSQNSTIRTNKILQRSNSRIYQLVLEVDYGIT